MTVNEFRAMLEGVPGERVVLHNWQYGYRVEVRTGEISFIDAADIPQGGLVGMAYEEA